MESLSSVFIIGAIGAVYGYPKESILHNLVINIIIPINSPNSPKNADKIRSIILKYLIEYINEFEVNNNPLIMLIAITIIIIGETIPALTAASPITKPPKIDTEVPTLEGILASLSLNISKQIIIKSASIKPGNGTPKRWDEKFINKLIGIDSGL